MGELKKRTMLDFSNFGIEGEYGLVISTTKKDNKFVIHLATKKKPSTEGKIRAVGVLMSELNDFVIKNGKLIVREAISLSEALKVDIDKPESGEYLEFMIKKYFNRYLKEHEIDILCKIEREKSPDYPYKYSIEYKK